MVYVFKTKVIYSCATISGRPVPGRKTTTGMFFIKEHQRHRLLKGDNYSTPCLVNWVRITAGQDTGFASQHGSHREAGSPEPLRSER